MSILLDIKLLRALIILGAILGLVPTSNLNTSKFLITYKSILGVWAISLRLFYWILVFLILEHFYLVTTTKSSIDDGLSELSYMVHLILSFCAFGMYFFTNNLTVVTIPKFVLVYNRIVDFTEKHHVFCYYGKKEIVRDLIFLGMLLIDYCMEIDYLFTRIYILEKDGKDVQFQYQVVRIPPDVLKFIYLVCCFRAISSVLLCVAFSTFFSQTIVKRLFHIQQTILGEPTFNLDFSNGSPQVFYKNIANKHLANLTAQVHDIQEIFYAYKDSISILMLISTFYSTIAFTVSVYYTIATLGEITRMTDYGTLYKMLTRIAILLIKLVCLTNSGDQLAREVKIKA